MNFSEDWKENKNSFIQNNFLKLVGMFNKTI
jgi:hypothetical protein